MCFYHNRLSSTQHPKQYEHLQAQSTFLRTIFPLPDPTNQATPHEQPLSSIDSTPTTLPRLSEELIHHVLAFQDGKVVHDFIEMYYALQDSHSVTSLALYCLQKVSIYSVLCFSSQFSCVRIGCENVRRDNAIGFRDNPT